MFRVTFTVSAVNAHKDVLQHMLIYEFGMVGITDGHKDIY